MKLKNNIEFLGKDYKKELIKILVINVIAIVGFVVITILSKSTPLIVIYLCIVMFLDFVLLTSYGDQRKRLNQKREYEFIHLLSYFNIFINNNQNVYQALNSLLPFCSLWMRGILSDLLVKIDEDKSVYPFIKFCENFESNVFQNLLISMYQMIDEGSGSKRIEEFKTLFSSINSSNRLEKINRKRNKLEILTSFPLIGAGYVTIVLTLSILSILGDMINVI